MYTKVIFLDIDGVLNGVKSKSYFIDEQGQVFSGIDKDKVRRLTHIVEETEAKIVLTSSWRIDWYRYGTHTLSNHSKYLTKHLSKKEKLGITDKTPIIRGGKVRGAEIKEWLAKHPEVTDYVILDDYPWADIWGDKELWRHLVKTREETGLTDADATAAIKVLQGTLIDSLTLEERESNKKENDIYEKIISSSRYAE